jgi:hypothetical protein
MDAKYKQFVATKMPCPMCRAKLAPVMPLKLIGKIDLPE